MPRSSRVRQKLNQRVGAKPTKPVPQDSEPGPRWLEAPEDHDYTAARDYLGLLFLPHVADGFVDQLREGVHASSYKAKDILRASGLPLLPADNVHVAKDLNKVAAGKSLSPILLVSGAYTLSHSLVIADGYHRVCASYHLDENEDIPCRIV